MTDINWD